MEPSLFRYRPIIVREFGFARLRLCLSPPQIDPKRVCQALVELRLRNDSLGALLVVTVP
jgi:hypothetical protein